MSKDHKGKDGLDREDELNLGVGGHVDGEEERVHRKGLQWSSCQRWGSQWCPWRYETHGDVIAESEEIKDGLGVDH